MREIELPAGTVPGSPEAVAAIASQMPPIFVEAPTVEAPAAVVAAVRSETGYDLIISGLEMLLDGFKELRDA